MTRSTLAIESVGATDGAGRRPSEENARVAIENFLVEELDLRVDFLMVPDGREDSAPNKCGWAFWIVSGDATSYLHEDLTVEWYGTSWGEDTVPSP